MSVASPEQIREQAAAVAALAQALADGTLVGPRYPAVLRLVDLVDTLRAWTQDDRKV